MRAIAPSLLIAVAAQRPPPPSTPEFSCSHVAPPAAPSGLSSSLKDKDCSAWQAFYDDAKLADAVPAISAACRRDPCESCVSASGRNLVMCTLHIASYDTCNGKDSDIGACNHISSINLSNQKLAGSIGTTFAQMSLINDLRLNNNALTGSIPDLSTMGQLAYVDLSGNHFTGVIGQYRTGFAYLSYNKNLSHLDFSGNQLRGPLPNFLMGSADKDSTSSQLAFFSVKDNLLSGTPPLIIGQLPPQAKVPAVAPDKVPGPCNPARDDKYDGKCDGYYLLKTANTGHLTDNVWFCPPKQLPPPTPAPTPTGATPAPTPAPVPTPPPPEDPSMVAGYAWTHAIAAGVLAATDLTNCVTLPPLIDGAHITAVASDATMTVSFPTQTQSNTKCETLFPTQYVVRYWSEAPPCGHALNESGFLGPAAQLVNSSSSCAGGTCTVKVTGLRNGCRALAIVSTQNCRGESDTSALTDIVTAHKLGYPLVKPVIKCDEGHYNATASTESSCACNPGGWGEGCTAEAQGDCDRCKSCTPWLGYWFDSAAQACKVCPGAAVDGGTACGGHGSCLGEGTRDVLNDRGLASCTEAKTCGQCACDQGYVNVPGAIQVDKGSCRPSKPPPVMDCATLACSTGCVCTCKDGPAGLDFMGEVPCVADEAECTVATCLSTFGLTCRGVTPTVSFLGVSAGSSFSPRAPCPKVRAAAPQKPKDETALVVASVFGTLSVAAAGLVLLSRRRRGSGSSRVDKFAPVRTNDV